MNGSTPFYYLLSVLGLVAAVWVAWQGFTGNSLSPPPTLVLGSFFIIKEILDMLH